MGRQLPIECEHGKIIDGGDFCDSEICPQCDFDPIGVEISGTETASLEDKYTALKAQHEALVEAANSLVAKRKNMNAILRVQEMDDEYLNLIEALAKCGEG